MADSLSVYLNDHHAGSVAALELLDRLVKAYDGTQWFTFFSTLRQEILADQDSLEQIIRPQIDDVGVVRQAAAWAAEKLSRAKIRLADPGEIDFGLYLSLEALVLGISGKAFLWKSLQAVATNNSGLQKFDFTTLIARANNQRERVEVKRLEIAVQVL